MRQTLGLARRLNPRHRRHITTASCTSSRSRRLTPDSTHHLTERQTHRSPVLFPSFIQAAAQKSRLSSTAPIIDSSKPRVYLLERFHPEAEAFARDTFEAIFPDDLEHHFWYQAEYFLLRAGGLTRSQIYACPNLRAVAKQGVGLDKIDTEACAERDVAVINTPGTNARAVAELVLGLVLAVAREFPKIHRKQMEGKSIDRVDCSGQSISGKTVGIVGMGNVGREVALMFHHGLGCRILAYGPSKPADHWADIPHTRADHIDDLLANSDIVSVHIPLTAETRGFISYPQMQEMKRTAIIVNTSRGGLVDEDDLERALREGIIWGAGLDDHVHAPPTLDKYAALWEQRVVSTPHIGAATSEMQAKTAIAAMEKLLDFIKRENGLSEAQSQRTEERR